MEPPPISGSVALYLPNVDGPARSEDTLVATTTTAPDGTFTLRADSSPALEAAAAANDGQINLDLVANVNGWVYNESVIRADVAGAWVDENGLTPPDIVILPTDRPSTCVSFPAPPRVRPADRRRTAPA